MTTSLADFRSHQPPFPSDFRQVRIGSVVGPNGITRFVLCGEFLASSDDVTADWTPFVTIETDPYEQWLGVQASAYCEQPSIVWLDGDYSSLMQDRLDASDGDPSVAEREQED